MKQSKFSNILSVRPNRLFDTDAQVRPRQWRSWLCAGQRRR